MPNFRNVNNYTVEVEKGDARVMLEPGGYIELTDKDAKLESNQAYSLMQVEKIPKPEDAEGGESK